MKFSMVNTKSALIVAWLFFLMFAFNSCEKEEKVQGNTNTTTGNPTDTNYKPTPYIFELPLGWSMPPIPADNPLTVEGIALGRKLFYDPILSADLSQSCASCHNQQFGFTDNGKRFSTGIDQIAGTRQSMPIFNLAWAERFTPSMGSRSLRFFWDGGATNLESQVIGPITNPIEMHDSLPNVLSKLQAHATYPELFRKAFGTPGITTQRLMMAIAQFERIIISSGSTFDKFLINVTPTGTKFFDFTVFTPEEKNGYDVFVDENKGDCFHCHPVSSPYLTDFQFHNNGHQSNDPGLQRITGKADDIGKFRTASLRNLTLTPPYMHDGSIATLEEVIEFYDNKASRVYPSDAFITKHPNGLNLTTKEKADLVAFLKTMTDSTFIVNPAYAKP